MDYHRPSQRKKPLRDSPPGEDINARRSRPSSGRRAGEGNLHPRSAAALTSGTGTAESYASPRRRQPDDHRRRAGPEGAKADDGCKGGGGGAEYSSKNFPGKRRRRGGVRTNVAESVSAEEARSSSSAPPGGGWAQQASAVFLARKKEKGMDDETARGIEAASVPSPGGRHYGTSSRKKRQTPRPGMVQTAGPKGAAATHDVAARGKGPPRKHGDGDGSFLDVTVTATSDTGVEVGLPSSRAATHSRIPGATAIDGPGRRGGCGDVPLWLPVPVPEDSVPDEVHAIEGFVSDPAGGGETELPSRNDDRQQRNLRHFILQNAPVVDGEAVVHTRGDGGGSNERERKNRCRRNCLVLGMIFLSVAASLSVGVVIGMNLSRGDNGGSSPAGSYDPTAPKNSDRFEAMKSVLVSSGVSPQNVFNKAASPQNRALKWLADEDRLSLDVSDDPRIEQRYRLATLFFSTGGDASWKESFDFMIPFHECFWNDGRDKGVFCEEDPRFIDNISLPGNDLVGPLPDELWGMSSLRKLHLPNNGLTGSISSSIRGMANLEYVNLDSNGLAGPVPDEIGELSQLMWLAMDRNNFSGSIPFSLDGLVLCKNISLAANRLQGTIPLNLDALSELKWFYLGHNSLTGTVPPNLPSSLTILDIPNNSFIGTIDLGSLSSLKKLNLGRNVFSGTVPSELTGFANLIHLRINDNKFRGGIPNNISLLQKLEWIDFASNELSNTIPNEISGMQSLKYLFLNDNKFNGSVPESFDNLTSLESLRLDNNFLTGDIEHMCEMVNSSILNIDFRADCSGDEPELRCSCCLCL